VVTGLIISVPIVVWGSTLVLKVVDRYPGVVYIGAGVLVWTAVKMILGEPVLRPWIAAAPSLAPLLYLAIPLILGWAFIKNHRRLESRIHARLAAAASRQPPGASSAAVPASRPGDEDGNLAELHVLVPVDGLPNALRAVRLVIAEYRRHHELKVHVLNVQPRLSRYVARFVGRSDRDAWLHERATADLAGAVALLVEADVPHEANWVAGDQAEEICRAAERLGAHHIVMATARKNSLTRMLEDSVTYKVLETTTIPVQVVAGDAVSKWERWGLLIGVLGVGGLLLLAAY